ncbi:MAG: HepT-like ribonuclease domain-containing protein [Methanobacteriota archaeon]
MESISRIETYAESGRESFFHSTLIQDGIVRNLEIIGEAANQLDDAFHAAHPEVEWRGMISLRNLVIHQYHRIDLNLIWRVVMKDIPQLKEHIEAIIETLAREERTGV